MRTRIPSDSFYLSTLWRLRFWPSLTATIDTDAVGPKVPSVFGYFFIFYFYFFVNSSVGTILPTWIPATRRRKFDIRLLEKIGV